MITKIRYELGSFGGDTLEATDGSYLDHDYFLDRLKKRIKKTYKMATIETVDFGSRQTTKIFAYSNRKDGGDAIGEEDDAVEDVERMANEVWNDIPNSAPWIRD